MSETRIVMFTKLCAGVPGASRGWRFQITEDNPVVSGDNLIYMHIYMYMHVYIGGSQFLAHILDSHFS